MASIIEEFKAFALKGNVVDLAIGIIIGAAFTSIVTSLVNDIMMPPLGWLMGGVDFSNFFLTIDSKGKGPFETLKAAQDGGAVVIAYGLFLNAVIKFVIVAFAVFILVKQINRLKTEAPAAPPAGPTPSEALLSEIRDILKAKG